MSVPAVAVRDLSVAFGTRAGRIPAVSGVGFHIEAGECFALVGESGSGKSVTARSLVGLAGPKAEVSAAQLEIGGRDVLAMSPGEHRALRGKAVGFVLQDALVSLDPLRTIGAEVAEVLRTHRVVDRRDIPSRVRALLEAAGIPDPDVRSRQHPHELSGGLRQRALIASAIAAQPALLIADEPTTALDVTVQRQILQLLRGLCEQGMALLLVCHDLSVVADLADRVGVMRDGVIVETGPTEEVLAAPQHPYTRRLLAAVPSAHPKGTRLSGRPAAPAIAPVRVAPVHIAPATDPSCSKRTDW